MKGKRSVFGYTLGEEIMNAVTHGIGALLGVAGTAVLIVLSALKGDVWWIVTSAIYGFTLILLFTMSTIYHALKPNRAKKVFRVFDHASIYLLIAGTYTPITLGVMRNALGWVLFSVVWGISILGIVLNSISIEKFKKISMIFYILTGWAVIMAVKPMLMLMSAKGLLLMLLGGIAYTGGIAFFAMKKVKYMHGIWHVFVLLGAVLQYFAVLLEIVK